jgi:hypothetical protein
MSEEAAHHSWGPSSLKQKINCLASDQATRNEPDVDNEASLSGTATHALVEKCRELDVPASTYAGHMIDVLAVDGKNREFLVDQARIDSAQTFIDHINDLPGVDFNEYRIRYPQFVPGAFGTLDGARGNDGIVYIRDFKDGGLLVYAKDNEQLLGQALGFYLDWHHLFDIKEFNLGIVQPRRDHVDTWTVSLEYLLDWAENTLKPAYVRAQQPNPPFTPGEWCTFCKIKSRCKARANSVFTELVDEFDEVSDAVEKLDDLTSPVGRLTNAEIALVLPKLPAIKAWCKDIEGFAFRQLTSGQQVGDYKLVEGKSSREFVPGAEDALRKAAIEVGADTLEDVEEQLFEPQVLKSPAQVEKILGKKRFAPATQKKPAGDLHHLVTKPKGRPVLVPGSDPRPPVTVDPGAEFNEVEDFE